MSEREVDRIHIEVSRLTRPVPLDYKDANDLLCKLRPNMDGVILRIKVTDCQTAGFETIDGVETSVLTYSVELPGSGIPPAQTRINIGVADNLPYKLVSSAGQTSQSTEYRYTGVKAPR